MLGRISLAARATSVHSQRLFRATTVGRNVVTAKRAMSAAVAATPETSMLGTLARIPMTNPFVFGVVFSTFKTSFSDWVVQRFVERRKEIDWRRNGTFAAFGCFYLGGVQYMIYVPFFQRIFPTAKAFTELPFAKKMTDFAGQRTVAYQVFIDQFVHHPLLYFPFFYTLKELVNGGPIDGGIKKYMTNYKEDLVALWKLWVPSTFLNFALMPMWARIPWVATTSLLWTCILSAMRGSEGTFEAHEELAEDIMLNPGRALTRALSNMESDYDRTQAHIVINAAGPDRVGYVHALASAMTSTGGNLIESKMMRLGGDFTVMMLMSCPPEKKRAITKALPKVEGMNITVRETTPWEESGHAAGRPEAVRAERFRANLLVTGPDQPGMLEAISGVCSKHKIDIKELSCKQFPVWLPDGNKQDNFHMRGYVRAFETVDVKAVRSVLDDLERKHKIKVILDTEME